MRNKKLDRMIKIETLNELQKQNAIANQTLQQKEKQFETKIKIEKEKLAVKDRANISLNEYNEMKKELKELREKVALWEKLGVQIKIGRYLDILDFNTIKVQSWHDPINCVNKIGISFNLKRR